MKVLSVVGQKGGPGKSTVGLHVATCAQAAGFRPRSSTRTRRGDELFTGSSAGDRFAPGHARDRRGRAARADPERPRQRHRARDHRHARQRPRRWRWPPAIRPISCWRRSGRPGRPRDARRGQAHRTARRAGEPHLHHAEPSAGQQPRTIEEGRAGVAAYGLELAPTLFHLRSDFARP